MSTSSARPGSIGRRSLLTGLGVAGSGLALAACGGPGSGSAGSGGDAGGGSDGGSGEVTGTVNFYHWRSEDKAVLDELAASFAE